MAHLDFRPASGHFRPLRDRGGPLVPETARSCPIPPVALRACDWKTHHEDHQGHEDKQRTRTFNIQLSTPNAQRHGHGLDVERWKLEVGLMFYFW